MASRGASRPRTWPPSRSPAHRHSGCSATGDVLLQVEAAQALAGAVGEHGDRVRRQARGAARSRPGWRPRPRSARARPASAAGSCRKARRRVRALEPVQRRVAERLALVVPGQVVGELQPAVPAGPVVADVPQGRVQVGPEGDQRPPAGPQRGEHLGERLGDQVVGVGRVAGQRVRQLPGGRAVPFVERAVRGGVARADGGRADRCPVSLPGIVIPAS